MKRFLLAALAAFFSFGALADVTLGPIVPATYTLYRGTSIAVDAAGNKLAGYTTEADCFAKAPENTEQLKQGATYYCKSSASRTTAWAAPVPPKPADVTKSVACVPPLVGTWTQTATWALVGSSWAQGAFLPATAPAGACVAPQPMWGKVASEFGSFTLGSTRTVRFGAGSAWVQKDLGAGTYSCSQAIFNSDPAPGVAKQCEAAAAGTSAPPVTPPVTPPSAPASTPPVSPGAPVAGVQVIASASRTSGTAPLAVLFDATASTVSGKDSFREIVYTFDFGDARGQTWAVSGKPKNSETGGPLAAHVFELPGTYTVKVSSNGSTATLQIVVADPNMVYAGANTVCVGKDFTGCPAGAVQQGAIPSSPVVGKRILLQRGQSFGNVDLQSDSANVQVGAYGTGAAPIVTGVGVGSWRPTTVNFPTDIVVADLSVNGGVSTTMGSRVLFLRNTIAPGQIQVALGNSSYWASSDPYRLIPTAAFRNISEVFVVENTGLGSSTTDTEYGFFGELVNGALLGNRFGVQKYHSARITGAHRAVVAHNELQGISGGGIYHALKVHSDGLNAYSDSLIGGPSGTGWASGQIVISSNLIGNANDNNSWTAAICPQNDQAAEGIENTIVEANTFVRGRGTSTDFVMGGRNITYRGNKTGSGGAISTGVGHTGALPAAWNGPYFGQ